MVIFMNIQNEILHHEILNEGTVDQVAIYPRRIIEKSLACHAAGVILSHNHPSGHTEPSEEDKRMDARDPRRGPPDRTAGDRSLDRGRKLDYFSFMERGLC